MPTDDHLGASTGLPALCRVVAMGAFKPYEVIAGQLPFLDEAGQVLKKQLYKVVGRGASFVGRAVHEHDRVQMDVSGIIGDIHRMAKVNHLNMERVYENFCPQDQLKMHMDKASRTSPVAELAGGSQRSCLGAASR